MTVAISFGSPLDGPIVVRSLPGPRPDPFDTSAIQKHGGVDLQASAGQSIYSVSDGNVIRASFHETYGNCVVIQCGDGVYALYAHLSELHVKVGNHISRGDRIGGAGDTGRATGSHLHFEMIFIPESKRKYVKITDGPHIGIKAGEYRLNPMDIIPLGQDVELYDGGIFGIILRIFGIKRTESLGRYGTCVTFGDAGVEYVEKSTYLADPNSYRRGGGGHAPGPWMPSPPSPGGQNGGVENGSQRPSRAGDERQRQLEEERRSEQDEDDRRRRADLDRSRQDLEERLRQIDDDRRRLEDNERRRVEEEQRQRDEQYRRQRDQEDEDRRRLEEEQRRRDDDDRLRRQQEEDDRRRKEDEDQRRRQEEELQRQAQADQQAREDWGRREREDRDRQEREDRDRQEREDRDRQEREDRDRQEREDRERGLGGIPLIMP